LEEFIAKTNNPENIIVYLEY
jgi:hypothetical protein